MADNKKKKKNAAEEASKMEEEVTAAEQTGTETDQAGDPVHEDPSAAELDALKAENEELKNKVLRQMAEFDNFKKRTSREKDELYNYAKANCAETILGVIDNFERALETECSDENFKKGVDMIFAQFKEALAKLGVEEISALNEPFDPEFHNAVNQIQDDQFGENTVCQVFQKGYKIDNKVIRHSMVVVANP